MYWDGMLPCWVCLRDDRGDPARPAASAPPRPRRAPSSRSSCSPRAWRRSRAGPAGSAGRGPLELAQLGLGGLEVAQARVELALLGGRLLAQVVGPVARVLDVLVQRGERLLVVGDLLGERLVLLADVEVVAHLGEQVGERPARQERLEQRGPVGVVGAADAVGEEALRGSRSSSFLTVSRDSRTRSWRSSLASWPTRPSYFDLDDRDPVAHPGRSCADDRRGRR